MKREDVRYCISQSILLTMLVFCFVAILSVLGVALWALIKEYGITNVMWGLGVIILVSLICFIAMLISERKRIKRNEKEKTRTETESGGPE